ncbi:hypothetical protein AMK59_2294, partial [Oryctes borbonicus]
ITDTEQSSSDMLNVINLRTYTCNFKGPSVIILSYPRYCRYRSVMKRLEGVENQFLRHKLVNALGGFSVPTYNTRILFCRDTFDYPELEGHELLCNHLAPKLKGRPRGKRKKRSLSPGSESNESECSIPIVASTSTGKLSIEDYTNGLKRDCGTIATRRSTRSADSNDSKAFLRKLTSFMKTNHTPIGRIPSLGYKELDLHRFYIKVQKYGGYDVVTTNRLWKSIFDDLGGNHGSTSAATVIRRHYERFLLPYERFVKSEEYKPLPVSERRRLKTKASRNSVSDAETSEGTSGSDNSTPMPQPAFPSTSYASFTTASGTTEYKDNPDKVKTSSLRSVRVKPERLREAGKLKMEPILKDPISDSNNGPITTQPKEEISENPKLLILPDKKDNEPTTTAVTPKHKISTEETLSPIESKEIPMVEIKEETEKSVEIIEIAPTDDVVHKDVIELDSTDVYKTINSVSNKSTINETVITEVKKQKLDILKQGGLEVTPVRNTVASKKESRPSVIHTAIAHRAEIIPNDVKIDDKKQMPPPQLATLTRRLVSPIIPTVPVPVPPKPPIHTNKTFPYSNPSPPKVLQSKSIYSSSGETVYGDPKDIFQPSIRNIQTPKFIENSRQQTGGDILDLTVKSPQKPTVQNAHIPPYHIPSGNLIIPSPFSMLDNRKVGSNLEITLVGASKNLKHINSFINNNHKKYTPKQRTTFSYPLLNQQECKVPQKRSNTDNYGNSKLPKVDDKIRNTTYSTQMYPPRDIKKSDFEPTINKQYKINNTPTKTPMTPHSAAKQPFLPPSTMFNMPSYIGSVAKGVPPFLHMDPTFYYLQSIYPPLTLPPMSLMPSPDSLQLYTEILSQNSRSRSQFPFLQDNSPMATTNNSKK